MAEDPNVLEALEGTARYVVGTILRGEFSREDLPLWELRLRAAGKLIAPKQHHEVVTSQPFIVVRQKSP